MIVGAGVTGCEAAWSAAAAGADVLLVTTSLDTVYSLDVEPRGLAPAAGSLLEVVAAGAAASRWEVHRAAKYALESLPGLHLLQSTVSAVALEAGRVAAVETWEGVPRRGAVFALCVGTFLRARLHVGAVVEPHGRLSEMAYDDLWEDLSAHGVRTTQVDLRLPAAPGALPHSVSTEVIARAEVSDRFAVDRLPGLHAAGACVDREGWPPSVEQCVAEGARLGAALAAQAPPGSSTAGAGRV